MFFFFFFFFFGLLTDCHNCRNANKCTQQFQPLHLLYKYLIHFLCLASIYKFVWVLTQFWEQVDNDIINMDMKHMEKYSSNSLFRSFYTARYKLNTLLLLKMESKEMPREWRIFQLCTGEGPHGSTYRTAQSGG